MLIDLEPVADSGVGGLLLSRLSQNFVAAFIAISGPMPLKSPIVIPTTNGVLFFFRF